MFLYFQNFFPSNYIFMSQDFFYLASKWSEIVTSSYYPRKTSLNWNIFLGLLMHLKMVFEFRYRFVIMFQPWFRTSDRQRQLKLIPAERPNFSPLLLLEGPYESNIYTLQDVNRFWFNCVDKWHNGTKSSPAVFHHVSLAPLKGNHVRLWTHHKLPSMNWWFPCLYGMYQHLVVGLDRSHQVTVVKQNSSEKRMASLKITLSTSSWRARLLKMHTDVITMTSWVDIAFAINL